MKHLSFSESQVVAGRGGQAGKCHGEELPAAPCPALALPTRPPAHRQSVPLLAFHSSVADKGAGLALSAGLEHLL